MQIPDPSTLVALKAIANDKRLQVLEWILDPRQHFPPQRDGDLVDDGVCIKFITDKIGLSQPTVTSHMHILCEAELVSSKQIKNWVFYKPNRSKIDEVLGQLNKQLKSGPD
jgi:DNA-binding transcriptional ArsR family regulator